MKQLLIILLLITFSANAKDHNPVLPQPQRVTYGEGQLLVKNLTIGFASAPSAEDRFAAKELAGILSATSSGKIAVKESAITGPSIIFKRTGGINPLAIAGEKPGPESRESYKIKVTAKNITVTAVSSAGLYYAVQTLKQLVEGSGDRAAIPEVEIHDWPSLAYRGFMMDMSHMQFPRVEEIKKQIDFLARWKTNQYFFYSEASIELDGYPLLMSNARYTKEQIRDIIAYAKARHIDVIPNMELYGHLHDLFKLEHYSDLSVTPYGGSLSRKIHA
ncbi:MAG: beta-N-acetylhexosaminidase [Daejeonella sp.]